ncbi:MAG: hypothetical protein JW793_13010, partial [Acidobacteria bacterium]|nr:hypothetical protein [Acidobacteriota bacterium]
GLYGAMCGCTQHCAVVVAKNDVAAVRLAECYIVGLCHFMVGSGGLVVLGFHLPIGPCILGLAIIPISGLLLSGRKLSAALPDLVFGGIDTGLLAVPALAGGLASGIAGAVAGGVVGDALTDAIAGFFEGAIAEWLRAHGYVESREIVSTALGKMAGCLLGSGIAISAAILFGANLQNH